MIKKTVILTSISIFLLSATSYAMPILTGVSGDGLTWTGSDSEGRSATAIFDYDGDNNLLSILLTNVTSETTSQPNQALAGLFFGFDGTLSDPNVTANPGDIHIAPGTQARADGGDSTVDGLLNGEFAFRSGIDDINGNLGDYGISSTAFDPEAGAPADWNGFGGYIIDESIAYPQINTPNGPGFTIAGATVGKPMLDFDYISNSVFMTFGFDGEFNGDSITQVNFLYGTDYAPVPEPATMLLFGTGLVGLAGLSRRKMRK